MIWQKVEPIYKNHRGVNDSESSPHSSSWQAPSAVGSKIVFRQDNALRQEVALARSINFGELITAHTCQVVDWPNSFLSKNRFGPSYRIVTCTEREREREGNRWITVPIDTAN